MTTIQTKPKVKRTPEERLAALKIEQERLERQLAAKASPQRAEALQDVIESIAMWSFTKVELAEAWPRKRAFAPRKKKVAVPSLVIPQAPAQAAA